MVYLTAYILNILDFVLTRAFVKIGFTEMNPAMNFLMKRNLDWFVKFIICGIGIFFLFWHRDLKLARIAIWIVLAFYAAVVLWNFIQYLFYLKRR